MRQAPSRRLSSQDLKDAEHTATAVYAKGSLPCTALLLHTGAGFLHDSLDEQAGSRFLGEAAAQCCLTSLLPSQRPRGLPRSTLSARASALSDILLLCCETITLCLIWYPLEQAVKPHLGAIAAKMEEMWSASQLSVSERNVLCDSMLAAAASGDPQLHSQVPLP